MITKIKLINISITHIITPSSLPPFLPLSLSLFLSFVVRTLTIYFPSKFQGYNMVSLTRVIRLYIRSAELVIITKSL